MATTLSAAQNIDNIQFEEQASTPSTPASGYGRIWVKNDGTVHFVNDAGTDTDLSSAGSGATTALDNLASVQVNDDIIPDAADTHDLGSVSAEWAQIWTDSLFANRQEMRVYNSSGSPIADESWVYVTGTQTVASVTLFTVDLADRDTEASARAIGVTNGAISNGSEGTIIVMGEATIDTTGESVGDKLYLSSTAGAYTTTKPTAGILQELGVVASVGASGLVNVSISDDLDLDTLDDTPTTHIGEYLVPSNLETTSGTYADIDGTNIKQTVSITTGEKVRAVFHIPRVLQITGGTGTYKLVANSTDSDTVVEAQCTFTTDGNALLLWGEWDSLTTASYDFKPQFKTSANTARVTSGFSVTWKVDVYA